MIQSLTMQEVRVESLEKLEALGDQMRLSANAGSLSIVFPRQVWERLIASAPASSPAPEELAELDVLREQLEAHAKEHSFASVLGGVRCGDSGLDYDLVLRPAGLFAMTTGYHFAPVVGPDLVARIGAGLEKDEFVEQAYVVGAVAGNEALAAGDEALRVLSVRGRSCSTSRFEMPPELWQVLSGRLGWRNVDTTTTRER
ncbi:MAG: hypothetical protein M3151_09795 [Actinomycetota bacterium]|nr:hypothetical protein [Actinomycetota bacterium]